MKTKKQKVVNIVRSETWLDDNFKDISLILEQTIKEFVSEKERIINVQVVKSDSGLSRFWIYTELSTPLTSMK